MPLAGLKIRPVPLTITFAITTALAFATAKYGRTQFATSYPEDQLTGKLWRFGWIDTGTTLSAALTALAQTSRRTKAG